MAESNEFFKMIGEVARPQTPNDRVADGFAALDEAEQKAKKKKVQPPQRPSTRLGEIE